MSVMLRKIARYVVQKAVSDPAAREKAATVARGVAAEAKQIAKQDDRAYATGRALRRAYDKLKENR
jgi:O-acetyl-ADP-ribose deacetylase (regulator of RNase III)